MWGLGEFKASGFGQGLGFRVSGAWALHERLALPVREYQLGVQLLRLGGKAGLLIRKHDHFTPTREIKRHVAHNHPEGWKSR